MNSVTKFVPTLRLVLLAALFSLMPAVPALADELYSERGFFIDLPEGFTLEDGDGISRFSFLSPDGALRLDIVVYDASRYASARLGADDLVKKLSAKGSPAAFRYAGRDAALGEISWGSGAQAMKAVAFFMDGKVPSGASAAAADAPAPFDLAIVAYAPAASWAANRDIALSALDGFSADRGRRASPGPVGTAARAALGAPKPSPATIAFGKARISASYDRREAAIAQDTVEREYRVLMPYGGEPDLIEAAVRRFYRMVWRDAAPSLDALALQLSAAWETGAWAGETGFRPVAPAGQADAPSTGPIFGAPAGPRAYAEALLSWTQSWTYERDPKGSDVVNPLSAAMEGRGDCDSRALVMSLLLRRENIEAALMISLAHEHALAAVDAPGPGARFAFREKSWLVGETTARVGIGMIAAEQADPADWFGVDFPF